eukprot:352040-Chlamydomonas_euryale.AAC.1
MGAGHMQGGGDGHMQGVNWTHARKRLDTCKEETGHMQGGGDKHMQGRDWTHARKRLDTCKEETGHMQEEDGGVGGVVSCHIRDAAGHYDSLVLHRAPTRGITNECLQARHGPFGRSNTAL